jgi:hypothetical protein
MKKLTILLFSILISFNSNAEVPKIIGGNTIKDICDISGCSEGISSYYQHNYLTKQKHKALAVSVRGNGKGIDGIYAGTYFASPGEVLSGVIKYCQREGGRNCKVLLLDNQIYDKELYKQLTTKSIPRNARASGNSWKCNYGYKKSGDRCIKETVIPTNAHASGSSWACNTGYKKVGSRCNKIYVPKNASLSGTSWKCNYGYSKIGTSCQVVPANATVTSSGWECNTGFTKDGNSCNKVEVSMDYIAELKKIKELLDSGVINEEEFKKMKQKIIDKM